LAAVPCPSLCNIQIANLEDKWKQLILGVYFLFGFRVNDIQNETFVMDSRRSFICSLFNTGSLEEDRKDREKRGVLTIAQLIKEAEDKKRQVVIIDLFLIYFVWSYVLILLIQC
jgi:hypothetical protein